MGRVRLDTLLAERGLAESRQKAQALVMAGVVTVDGTRAQKSGQLVRLDAALEVKKREPYVSRGGYKLAHALDRFGISVDGLVAVDVGASTGGFTDVLLQRGARRVYAVDVGYGQLHARLRADARVIVLDRTNVRQLETLPDEPDLATVDVSFISLRLVIPVLHRLLKRGSSMIVLVKPQFEAGRDEVGRGGVVRSAATHRRVLEELAAWLITEDLSLRGITASPIRGPAGNVEFLAWLGPVGRKQLPARDLIERALAEAHGVDWKEASRA
jgi:23S rRNA (cytidine1920-2'-O)/16S rRNA (cytidine1409-2'-O)-methyltransferase